ncbi:MAG: MBL fold metallo-hydrolase [Clostridiales bacterium]|nr:MBL fold metallo-hydrolase [Clostridiales bacterium]
MKMSFVSKKFLCLLMVLAMCLAFACNSLETLSDPSENTTTTATEVTTTAAPTTTTEVTTTTETATTAEITTTTEATTTTEVTTTTTTEETTTTETPAPSEETTVAPTEAVTAPETTAVVPPSEVKETEEAPSTFVVHFIDVGQGDASLILCDGEAMLIDAGASDQSELIFAYLKKNEITKLKYIVGTHPDDDHIGGLAAALNYASVERAFCSVDDYDSKAFVNYLKYLNKQKVELEIPEAGMELELGSAKVTFLGPISQAETTNNNSIVIRVEYGETAFLFTGDAEYEEEQSLLYADGELSATVLKVAHHGSEYSSTEDFLDAVSPQYAVISCGNDNSYGFPTQKILDRLKERDVELYRTDMQGDILAYSDGKTVTFETEKELSEGEDLFLAPAIIAPVPSGDSDCDYICNTNSKKFHYPDCEAVLKMKEKNKMYFTGDREELIQEGYVPCKICRP